MTISSSTLIMTANCCSCCNKRRVRICAVLTKQVGMKVSTIKFQLNGN